MSAFKGTPGPWRLVRSVKTWQMPLQIEAADGLCIVALDAHPLHDMEANARLITAAPESHEANKLSLTVLCAIHAAGVLSHDTNILRDLDLAIGANRAAIAKALGTDEPIPGSDDLEGEE